MAGLLNVGEMGALGLHVLVKLAVLREQDPDGRFTAQEMADSLHASVHTLQKVTRRLVMMGLLEGTRGANGGLRLAVEPGDVTMLQVIEGIEGRVCANGCMFAKRVCPQDGRCVFENLTQQMERRVRDYLSETTVAELRDAAMQTA